MKKFMRNLLALLVLAFAVSLPVAADKDQPIEVKQLPAKAQQIIHQHFEGIQIALAKKEKDLFGQSYEVIFTNGDKVEFNQRGEWTDLKCQTKTVPQALVPSLVATYVKAHYPNTRILELERNDRKGYEVRLSNGYELELNSKGKLVELDHKR